MSLTDIFISPAGAGDNSGSSVANALPAISSGDWSTGIEALDRAGKRLVWLAGTYDCTTTLEMSGSVPTDESPCQWVGADADGNILRPKFDETGLRLDLTNYPKIVCSANTTMYAQEEHTFYKCISFENTNTSYSQGGIVDATTADIDNQYWFGCNFKAAPGNANSEVMVTNNCSFHTCVFEATVKNFDRIVDMRSNSHLVNCRIIGAGTGAGTGDGDGVTATTTTAKVIECVICNVHGDGYFSSNTNTRVQPHCENCTIINCGVNGMAMATPTSSNASLPGSINNNIIFNCANSGMKCNAADDRQSGCHIVAMGSNGTNLENFDDYEDMIDVIPITTADFVDYDNNDFRIRRDSVLYKFYGTKNFGAIQNEDYEFVGVS